MLRLSEGEHLRRAAVLLFHPDPARFFAGAFVKIGYFRAEADLAYQDVIEGNLFVQVDRVVDLLRTKYSKARISYEGIYRRETPPAPSSALREAVMNAIVHRDYSNPAPIQIRVYDDRIALWNPGALPLGWTLEEFMGTHASAPQNPGVANAFFRAGMIEAWGRGIADIVRACRVAGTADPQWAVEPGSLRLDFRFTGASEDPLPRRAAQGTGEERRDAPRKSDGLAHDSPGRRRAPARVTARVTARVSGGESASATGGWTVVKSGSLQKLGAEEGIRPAQQSNQTSRRRWKNRTHDAREAPESATEVPPEELAEAWRQSQ